MFWLKRMKRGDDDGWSWALPYGDLMCLLLAVFVMIAAMSELRAGERFDAVGSAAVVDEPVASVQAVATRTRARTSRRVAPP